MVRKSSRKRKVRRKPASAPALHAGHVRPVTAAFESPHTLWNRYFILAVAVSILCHLAFLLYTRHWEVANVTAAESNVETLFRVKFRDLESLDFISRPTLQQFREEREKLLQDEIASIETQAAPRSAVNDLNTSLPALDNNLPDPTQIGDREDDFYVDDTAARSLITSDIGSRAVNSFEDTAGSDIVDDEIESNRIALMGRGGGSTRRIMEDLPEPEVPDEPAASRTIAMTLITDMNLPEPNLDIEEPPIELPDDTELLPSPEILPEAPIVTPLKQEEKAIEQIQDKFIQLDDLVQIELFTYHHIGGDGYFMIRIRPRAADERLKVLPKDVIFVLDASASMGRLTIGVVKEEIRKAVKRLRPNDRFNVVGFNQRVRRFARDFSPVNNETINKVWNFLYPLKATGMTDIYSSLEPLVQLGIERARPLIVLLISDGRPNVGMLNSRKIINSLTRFQGPSTSIYCVGTGSEVNVYLLDMLAFRNRGEVWFAKDRDAIPQLMPAVFGYLEDPMLLRIKANFSGIDESEVYPKRLPDLNLKGELRLWGRLKDEKTIPLRLVGEAWDEQKEIVFDLPVPEVDNATYEIARAWARSKIYNIAAKMVTEGEKQEYLDEINFLSRTYRVETPYSDTVSSE